jgi:hypothetical protein
MYEELKSPRAAEVAALLDRDGNGTATAAS